MANATCPICTGEISSTWTNKRRQVVGKCKACGKLVILGKTNSSSEENGGKEENKPIKKAADKTSAATSGAKPASASARKPGGRRRPAVGPKQRIQPQAAGADPIARAIKWLFS